MMGKRLNTREFVERSLILHGNKYNYSKSNYVHSHKKIKIICKIHGEFLQMPHNHLNGAGCLKCAIENQHALQKKDTKYFIEKSKKIHGNKYNYSCIDYEGAFIKVSIICKRHGKFLQTPSNHYQGHGCPECRSEKISKINRTRILDDNTIKKMRISAIKRIEKHKLNKEQLIPGFNPDACKIIEDYGKENSYNFQHAMNGGEYHIKELGYWVDGYDKDKNVVIEIDEKRHFNKNGKLKQKDIKRMDEIKQFLNCKFIRLKFEENK